MKFAVAVALILASTSAQAQLRYSCPSTETEPCKYWRDGAVIMTLAPGQVVDDDGTPRTWHLLTITEGGTVSLLKQLTKHECEFAMHRALGQPATDEEIAAAKKAADERLRRYEEFLSHYPICKKSWPNLSKDDQSEWEQVCNNGHVGGYSSVAVGPGTIRSAECFE